MAINKRLLVKPPSAGGITPSEHFGVVLYEGDGSSSHSINGGKFGAAFYGNGSNSYIDFGDNIFKFDEFSISFWVNVSSFVNNQVIYNHYDEIPNQAAGILFRTNSSGNILVDAWTPPSTYGGNVTSTSTLSANTWYHIGITLTQSEVKIYINGSLDKTGSISGFGYHSTHNFILGAFLKTGGSPSSFFNGKIDQFRMFQKVLDSSEVSTLYAETLATSTSLNPLSEDTTNTLQVLGDSSCIATYRFENNEDDLSGNYNGTGTAIQYAAGRYGQGADFNGTTSEIVTTGYSDFNTTTLSISCWVYLHENSTENHFVSRFGGCGNHSCYTFILRNNSSGYFNLSTYDGTGTSHNASLTGYGQVQTNRWYHIVAVINGTSRDVYINGANEYTNTASFSINTSSTEVLNIGGRGDMGATSNTGRMNGVIDQVRIFNKAISASEVTTLYNENSLVASYRFEGNANDDTRNYDGTASNVTYEYGLNGFTPDLVWIKGRTSADNHFIFDSTRGDSVTINTNLTAAQYADTGLTSFDTGGFTLGSGAGENRDGDDYVAWCLKANGGTTSSNTDGSITSTVQVNETAGFSIISYTGNGTSGATIGHGLTVAPELLIFKRLNASESWNVWSSSVSSKVGFLNLPNAFVNYSVLGTGTSTITLNNGTGHNASSSPYICYAFASTESFSKFGSYTGTGGDLIVETGFEPAFLMIKRTDSGFEDWFMLDNKRNPVDYRNTILRANANTADTTVTNGDIDVKFLSNGFAFDDIPSTSGGFNASGGTYIYMAFAADPDTVAPAVAKSFSTVSYTGTGATQSIEGLGFSPSLVWLKNDTYYSPFVYDTIRGATKTIYADSTSTQQTESGLTSFDNDGFTLGSNYFQNRNGDTYYAWAWKADDNEPTITGGPAVAAYKFEDNSNDVAGDYNGTDVNMTYTSSGKFNKAAVFNGTNGYITLPNGSFTFNDFSLSVWIYPTTSTGLRIIFENYEATSGSKGISTRLNSNNTVNLQAYNSDAAGNRYIMDTTTTVTTNQWNHLVFVLSKTYGQGKIFINGEEASYASGREYGPFSFYSNAPSTIGATRHTYASGGYEYPFVGRMDQMRFFNGYLSDADVTALYAETSSDNDNLSFVEAASSIVSANANAGFSVVKYKGDGVAGKQVPHGLSAAPEMIILKDLDQGVNWGVYHVGTDATSPEDYKLELNVADARIDQVNAWNDTAPNATTFTLGGGSAVNKSGNDYIAYCWHSVSGYSKFGSYTGNGSSNSISGLGFQPDWILIKDTGAAESWRLFDSVRNAPNTFLIDAGGAETTDNGFVSFDSDGFTLGNDWYGRVNQNAHNYIYMAFKIN